MKLKLFKKMGLWRYTFEDSDVGYNNNGFMYGLDIIRSKCRFYTFHDIYILVSII